MKLGVQLHEKVNSEQIVAAGFSNIEIMFQSLEQLKMTQQGNICGVCIKLAMQTEDVFQEVVTFASENHCYIVLDTRDVTEEKLYQFVATAVAELVEKQVPLYIENGFVKQNNQYAYGAYSDADDLLKVCDELEKRYVGIKTGVAVDIGNANALSKNIAGFIMKSGDKLQLVHVNDNNGDKCQRQMPFTFTTGRGTLATDWNRILGALMKIGFDGYFIYNTTGLYDTTPKPLIPEMLQLQKVLADRFEKQFHFEEVLAQEGKQIVLFGAGAMATNYMKTWGEKYPPVFVVDNNAKRWGEAFYGTEIKNPEEVLHLDEEKRVVIICNMYYNEIRKQLTQMGVAFEYYNDEFY